jgi:hypothetical protein
VERGQGRGEITRSVPVEWAVSAMRSVLLAAIEELGDGRLDERDAERFAIRTVMQGLSTGRGR